MAPAPPVALVATISGDDINLTGAYSALFFLKLLLDTPRNVAFSGSCSSSRRHHVSATPSFDSAPSTMSGGAL